MATRPLSAILYSKDERFLSERNTHMLRLKGFNCITALFLIVAATLCDHMYIQNLKL